MSPPPSKYAKSMYSEDHATIASLSNVPWCEMAAILDTNEVEKVDQSRVSKSSVLYYIYHLNSVQRRVFLIC